MNRVSRSTRVNSGDRYQIHITVWIAPKVDSTLYEELLVAADDVLARIREQVEDLLSQTADSRHGLPLLIPMGEAIRVNRPDCPTIAWGYSLDESHEASVSYEFDLA